jgi:hypothetical protein
MPALVAPQLLLCGLVVSRDDMAGRLHAVSGALPFTYAYDALGAGHQPGQPRSRYGRRHRLHRRRHDRRASGAKDLFDPRALDVGDPGE